MTAREKHAEERATEYRRKMDTLTIENRNLKQGKQLLTLELDSARAQNRQLTDWVERLLEYTELSLDDIRASVEKDKAMKNAADLLSFMSGFAGRY